MIPEISEKERARRRKKNAKRKAARLRLAASQALPPVVGLSKRSFLALVGQDADYDMYAEQFIAGAKAKGRRYDFPLEPLAGIGMAGRNRMGFGKN